MCVCVTSYSNFITLDQCKNAIVGGWYGCAKAVRYNQVPPLGHIPRILGRMKASNDVHVLWSSMS